MSFIDYVQRRISGKIIMCKPQNSVTTAYILTYEMMNQFYCVSAVVTTQDDVDVAALLQVKDLQINRIIFDDNGSCKDVLHHFEEWLGGCKAYVCKSDEKRGYFTTRIS